MPSNSTALDDVILAVVSAMNDAVTYEVFDGPPTTLPNRDQVKFLVIGAEAPLTDDDQPPVNAADVEIVWKGLGQARREEEMRINCVAVAKSTTAAASRALCVGIMDDVQSNLGLHPGNLSTFNALISAVNTTRVKNVMGGTVVQMQFTISVRANLT
jgi:hypothetical protein